MTAENELGVTSMKSEKSGLEAVAIVQVSLNVPGRRDDAPIGSSFLLYFIPGPTDAKCALINIKL